MQPEIVQMSRFTVNRSRITILAPESASGQREAFHIWIQILTSRDFLKNQIFNEIHNFSDFFFVKVDAESASHPSVLM